MKKKLKICIGATLFMGGAIIAVTGVIIGIDNIGSILGVIGCCMLSVGVFGLYYGALLLRKNE